MRQILLTLLLGLFVSGITARAEDWTTTDGKTFLDVKVIKVDPDAVTIIHHDGGSSVPLASLPSYLQKRFKYDPAKAHAAAATRAKADQESIAALQAEKDKENAQTVAAAQGLAKAAAQQQTNAAGTALTPTPAKKDPLQSKGGNADGPRDIEHSDPRTHYQGI